MRGMGLKEQWEGGEYKSINLHDTNYVEQLGKMQIAMILHNEGVVFWLEKWDIQDRCQRFKSDLFHA